MAKTPGPPCNKLVNGFAVVPHASQEIRDPAGAYSLKKHPKSKLAQCISYLERKYVVTADRI